MSEWIDRIWYGNDTEYARMTPSRRWNLIRCVIGLHRWSRMSDRVGGCYHECINCGTHGKFEPPVA